MTGRQVRQPGPAQGRLPQPPAEQFDERLLRALGQQRQFRTGRSWAFGGAYRQFLKTTDVPQPTMTYLTLEEHPDSINDAFFVTDPAVNYWQNIPASYHNGACGFSFSDGHAEIKAWKSRASKYPVDYNYGPNIQFDAAGKQDMLWYKERIQMIPYR